MARRKSGIDPEVLRKLKFEVAQDLGMTQYIKENNDHYKGDLPSKVNGSQGGPIGGEMVRRIIQAYKSNQNQ